jgi:hypothetical protein
MIFIENGSLQILFMMLFPSVLTYLRMSTVVFTLEGQHEEVLNLEITFLVPETVI